MVLLTPSGRIEQNLQKANERKVASCSLAGAPHGKNAGSNHTVKR